MSFLGELKRRNVVRVGVFYAVTSWLLLQVADVLTGLLALPDWTLRLVGMILLLGLPVALVFSWVYELTPGGLKRDSGATQDPVFSASTAQKLNVATLAAAAIAIALVGWQQYEPEDEVAAVPDPAPDTEIAAGDPGAPQGGMPEAETAPTIAVLPFANLSDDSENEYFVDGVAEEVLNLLARSEDLRVISRSSAFSFKGRNVPIPEIAAQLRATHVLEGSIRRAGNRVRVTTQLIEADTDVHLWSETYDRELVDIFALQDEIAGAIAEALEVTLLEATPRPMDIDVYDMVLRARALGSRRDNTAGLRQSVEVLLEATRIAPENAEAWGQLALAQMLLTNWEDTNAPSLGLIEEYATEALALDDRNVSALTAMGAWHLFSFEFEAAEERFQAALAVNPNSVDAANWYGDFLVITNRPEEALVWEGLAARLDPLLAVHHLNLGFAHAVAGDRRIAVQSFLRALEIDPSFSAALDNLGLHLFILRDFDTLRTFAASYVGPLQRDVDRYVRFAALIEAGDEEGSRAMIEALPVPADRIFEQRMLHRDNEPAVWDAMAAYLAANDDGYPFYLWPSISPTNPQYLALSHAYADFWRTPPRDRVLKVRGHWIPLEE